MANLKETKQNHQTLHSSPINSSSTKKRTEKLKSMAAQDYVVPPAYSYTTESSRRSDRINTVVRDLRSSVANYRDEERRLNESTRYPESVRSGADTQYENKVQKQNEILTKQLMFYRAQAGDLDRKLREATNLLESTVLEIQSKPGIGNSEELYLENQELKKRLQVEIDCLYQFVVFRKY